MLIKNKIIIIPLSTPWEWTADYIRQTATILNKYNKIILYDQSESFFFLKKINKKTYPRLPKITFFKPKYYLPFRRLKFIESLNRKLSFYLLLKKYKNQEKVVWIFDPEYYDFATIKTDKLVSIYDCVDYYSSLEKEQSCLIRIKEKILAKNIDLFIVNSDSLYKIHRKIAQNIFKVKAQGFVVPNTQKIEKADLQIPKPIIGFAGGLNYRLDFPLLIKLVRRHPRWSFVFFGYKQFKSFEDRIFSTAENLQKISKYRNVHFFQAKNRQKLYSAIKCFDVAIIPYNTKIDFNKYCYPMKLYEYFYFGKPVVSTSIEELKKDSFNKFVKIADGLTEWEKSIKQLLDKPWPEIYKKRQRLLSFENNWEKKIEDVCELINKKCYQ